jgi:hypothetical protein
MKIVNLYAIMIEDVYLTLNTDGSYYEMHVPLYPTKEKAQRDIDTCFSKHSNMKIKKMKCSVPDNFVV